MPKRKFGCTNCFDVTVELKLVKMITDKTSSELFLITHQCPICGQEYYDTHNKSEIAPYTDEYLPAFAAKQIKLAYREKLKIYNKLQDETNKKEIKQDKFYDVDFNPETTEQY